MGYYIESKKINIILNEKQQEQIFDIWMNPPTIGNPISDLLVENFSTRFKRENCKSIKDILSILSFQYEDCKKGLKLKSFGAKMKSQDELFELIGDIITPGSFLTLRGEDGAIFGWFFNGKLEHYSSYKELKKLSEFFELKDNLVKTLPNEKLETKNKPKI